MALEYEWNEKRLWRKDGGKPVNNNHFQPSDTHPTYVSLHDGQAAQRTRVRSRSKFARPYMLRLMNLSRLTFPSTGPCLHFKLSPALTAASSRCNPFANLINSSIPLV